VHKGFYEAEQIVIAGIISEVKSLQSAHSGYAVKVTGHSLGAALAQLTSMDLKKAGISNSVYNFGQPRTGDQKYASFATSKVSTVRVTHNKDTVPHLPYTEVMEFYHVCTEEFENSSGSVKQCDSSCEDKTCMDQVRRGFGHFIS
jgi:predicted lipase